jgi:hypothetical protein
MADGVQLLAPVVVLCCALLRLRPVTYGSCDVLVAVASTAAVAAAVLALAAVAAATAAAAAAALNPSGTIGDVTSCDLRSVFLLKFDLIRM